MRRRPAAAAGAARTPAAGEWLVGHVERLMGMMEEAEADIAAERAEVTGTVRIAAFPSAAAALMPRLVLLLQQRHLDRSDGCR